MSAGLVAMQYIASSTNSVQSVFYNNMAKEAANAGATFAYNCLHANDNIDNIPWSSRTLRPNYNCNGYNNAAPNDNRVNTSATPNVYLRELSGPSTIRTTFEVQPPSTGAPNSDINNSGAKVTSVGRVEFYYAGSSTPTRVIEQRTIVNIPIDMTGSVWPIAQGKAVTQISSGLNFSCAVANQEMYCWGANNANQLGMSLANVQGITWDAPFGSSPPNCGGGIFGWACDTTWDTAVSLWYLAFSYGAGFFGGLFDVTLGNIQGVANANVNAPSRNNLGVLAGDKRVDSISVGSISGCAVVEGRGACWGSNPHGQIGNGDKSKFLDTIQTMLYLAALIPDTLGGSGMVAAAVYAYNVASEQLLAGDDIYTSGRYTPTYIGNSNPTRDPERWDLKNISKISNSASILTKIDRSNTCVISNGEIGCWGNNNAGQMNTPTFADGTKRTQTCTPGTWMDREPVWGNTSIPRTGGYVLGPGSITENVPNNWNTTRTGNSCNQTSNYVAPICATGTVGSTLLDTHYPQIRSAGNNYSYDNTFHRVTNVGWPISVPFTSDYRHQFSGNRWNTEYSASPVSVSMRNLCRGILSTPEVGAPAVVGDFTDFDYYVPKYMLGYGATEGRHLSHLWSSATGTRKQAIDTTAALNQPCALVDGGEVYCWTGDLTKTLANTSVNTKKSIPGNTPITSIAGNGTTMCGVGNGKLYCWGKYRGNGTNIGELESDSQRVPVDVTPPGAVIDNVYSFNDNSGAICATGMGKAWCWGKALKWKTTNLVTQAYGQDQATPELYGDANLMGLPTGSKITQMSPGAGGDNLGITISSVLSMGSAMCAIANATPYCTGDNLFGQLGRGNNTNTITGNSNTHPTAPGNNIKQFNRTYSGTDVAAVNIPAIPPFNAQLQPGRYNIGLTAGKAATAIDAGNKFTCAVIDAAPFCWGRNSNGQLGDGTNNESRRPISASYMSDKYTTRVSAGDSHTCSITNGRAYCWGNGADGRLGKGNSASSSTPEAVPSVINNMAVTDISAGTNHTCAVANSQAYCWGGNGNGQLGTGSTTPSSSNVPVQVTGLSGKLVTKIAAGNNFTCAIADSKPYCWGAGSSGQIGNNAPVASQPTPQPVSDMNGASTDISVGTSSACAVEGGVTRCWGSGADGRLGRGGVAQSNVPVNVVDAAATGRADNSTALSVGDSHACSLTAGYLRCWGSRADGRIGNPAAGVAGNSETATLVTEYSGASSLGADNKPTSITAGTDHSCAIANAKIFCWGNNSSGQLGNSLTLPAGTTAPSLTSDYSLNVRKPAWASTVFY